MQKKYPLGRLFTDRDAKVRAPTQDSLLDLPLGLIKGNIGQQSGLELDDLCKLAKTCKTLNGIYKPLILKRLKKEKDVTVILKRISYMLDILQEEYHQLKLKYSTQPSKIQKISCRYIELRCDLARHANEVGGKFSLVSEKMELHLINQGRTEERLLEHMQRTITEYMPDFEKLVSSVYEEVHNMQNLYQEIDLNLRSVVTNILPDSIPSENWNLGMTSLEEARLLRDSLLQFISNVRYFSSCHSNTLRVINSTPTTVDSYNTPNAKNVINSGSTVRGYIYLL
ncbi:MAG: hypothetical protein HYX60_07125, partial [Legionella longbeachae]|nr:hypothetical protein [Legionella longbeachae]